MNKRGFTLIEVLVVLVMVSILVILSIPSISDMLDKSKQKSKEEVLNMVKSAAEMYASDYDIGLAEPIDIATLCKNYLKCPIKDPITDLPITGYVYSRIDKTNDNTRVFELMAGTPVQLSTTIISTVGGKDIAVNKYVGNGLYKWGNKYIYRGGLTKTNPAGLTTVDYQNDTDSGSQVSNYIQVPWETYAVGETCSTSTNKCYRIISINEDGSMNIIRDKGESNQLFDDVHNTAASTNYSQPGINYGYNSLLENVPTKGYPAEYRKYSKMYLAVYGDTGYEKTTLKSYKTLLEEINVCLNSIARFKGMNAADYATTTNVTDTCNINGKPSTNSVYPLKQRLVRSMYTEEFLNASTESTCYTDYSNQYQCRNQNYLYNKENVFIFNPLFGDSWSVRLIANYGIAGHWAANNTTSFRPVVTLRENIIIIGGIGTQANPYVIAN